MKKILITGGAGFIGQSLVKSFIDLNYEITVLDNLDPQVHGMSPLYQPLNNVKFIRIDLNSNSSELCKYFEGIDVLIHLASLTGTAQSMYQIRKYVKNNDEVTSNILEILSKIKRKPKLFILSSSRSVYGEGMYTSKQQERIIVPDSRESRSLNNGKWGHFIDDEELVSIPTSEDSRLSPASIYAANKVTQEMLVSITCKTLNINFAILRLQNVYGPGQSLQNPYTGIISIFYNRIRQGLDIELFEDGNPIRDFIYIDDVTEVFKKIINYNNKLNIILNVGSGVPTTINEISKCILKYSSNNIKANISGQYRAGDIRSCYANINKLKKILNFEPRYSIELGIDNFIKWANTQPIYISKHDEAMLELKTAGLSK